MFLTWRAIMRFPDIELETKSITDEFIVNVKDLIVRKSAEDHQALICYIDIMKKKEIDPIHILNRTRLSISDIIYNA